MVGGVISPAMVLPLSQDDHVNNHLCIGDHPPTTVNTLLCQVEAIPCKSEGIEPFIMVNTPPCQVGVTPRKSEGIEPFTMVNTPPCQVGVTPRKSEGIEPFNMVNTPPCQVEALSSHPINAPSGHLEDTSSPLIPASVPIASHVPLVKSPPSSWPVTDLIAPMVSSATSHKQPVDIPIRSEHP